MEFVPPSPLTHASARFLEFGSVLELLAGYASSGPGRQAIAALVPSGDAAWIGRQQQLTDEVRRYWRGGGRFEFAGLISAPELIDKARIEGSVLEVLEIRDLVASIDRAAEWREIALHPPRFVAESFAVAPSPASAPVWPAVEELARGIADFTDFLRFFRRKILPDGTLDDRSSPALAAVRRDIEKQKRSIQESLHGYLRRLAGQGAAQEEFITIRGERFVIPVKMEQKRRVEGVVHGVSASGQTAFVEPLETIEQNNELVRLLEQEQAEIHRILLEMTGRIAEMGQAILAAAAAMAEFEVQFAKARFAEEYACAAPVCAGSRLRLIQARHPLLERALRARAARAVPMTLELERELSHNPGGQGAPADQQRLTADGRRLPGGGEAACQLVITGPNTGGKTVALKTLGLLALMAQAGIPVPAVEAELPLFDAVLADIGDYQSIEQNLSTFSAHVTNIEFISRTATPQSLVLLDELGSATDPEEGAALAVAIADYFRALGCVSAISTHHTSLKVYAANSPGVVNAAVGFDEATLQPTYELRVGVPGASAGINIAQRLGLNPAILEAARRQMGSQSRDVSRFLDRLHEDIRALEAERERIRHREQELAREKNRLAAEGKQEQRQKVRELERKLEDLLAEFEHQARENVAAVQDRAQALKLSKDAERRVARLRRDFREQFNQAVVAATTGADVGDENARPGLVRHVREGDLVRLRGLGRNARILRKVDEDHFEAEAGSLKMRIRRSDIAELLGGSSESPAATPLADARRRTGVSVSVSDEAAVSGELNVIGHTADEAISAVEKYLDRAFLAGLPRVRVVHGSGMGVLRKAVRDFVKKHPHVASVTEPPQQEGGAGATVIELRV
ncbi:MAG: Smr/MutS family protein [Acidobacteria bacterium]|nr:Smr/MutS family protein [Acidobacteriota bacterium]